MVGLVEVSFAVGSRAEAGNVVLWMCLRRTNIRRSGGSRRPSVPPTRSPSWRSRVRLKAGGRRLEAAVEPRPRNRSLSSCRSPSINTSRRSVTSTSWPAFAVSVVQFARSADVAAAALKSLLRRWPLPEDQLAHVVRVLDRIAGGG